MLVPTEMFEITVPYVPPFDGIIRGGDSDTVTIEYRTKLVCEHDAMQLFKKHGIYPVRHYRKRTTEEISERIAYHEHQIYLLKKGQPND